MNSVLSGYRSAYASNTPIVNQRLSADGAALNAQDIWAQTLSAGTVSGYIQGNTVTVTGPSGTSVPVTVPNGTRVGTAKGSVFGTAYAGEHSDRTTLGSGPLTLVLTTTPYPAGPGTAAATAANSPADPLDQHHQRPGEPAGDTGRPARHRDHEGDRMT